VKSKSACRRKSSPSLQASSSQILGSAPPHNRRKRTWHDMIDKDLQHHVPLQHHGRGGRGGGIYNTVKAQRKRHAVVRGTAVQPATQMLVATSPPTLGHAPDCVHQPCMSLSFSWVLPAVTVPCTADTCEALTHIRV
jgi:hypothetical protein